MIDVTSTVSGTGVEKIDVTSGVKKRNTAYKFFIKDIMAGKPVMDGERLSFLEIRDKKIVRVNVVGSVIDKFVSEGEKKYAALTLDDATGQLRAKLFGEDIAKANSINLGDAVVIIGIVRVFNNEIYITPEIIKNVDHKYLVIRKLELSNAAKHLAVGSVDGLREKIIEMVREAELTGGIEAEQVVLKLPYPPEGINREIKKLLEDGAIYESRPGMLRALALG